MPKIVTIKTKNTKILDHPYDLNKNVYTYCQF